MNFTTASSPIKTNFANNSILHICVVLFSVFWISTLVGTNNISNWIMENVLVIIFLSVLIISYKKFVFSDISYVFITIYLLLHIYGSKYTYAENPFGYWLKDYFHFTRNHYDRIVHCSFGLLLAYPMRDFFKNYMQFPAWVCWSLPIEITLSFSCLYELIEWAVADIFFPKQGDAYLGTQGDIWDAQKDMFLAFVGALFSIILVYFIKKIKSSRN
jgi:putative membrane protein